MSRMKKVTAVLLVCIMMAAVLLSPVSAAAIPYTDVSKNWAYNSIVECYENGWITGTTSTTFSPSGPLTRAQFVTILGRYAGANVKNYSTSSFADVDFSSWGYAPYVSWAEERGIVHGLDEAHFQPGGVVTRAQLVVFLYNYVQYLGVELKVTTPDVTYTDEASIPSYARSAVMALSQAGVISGSNGAFLPGAACTREMAAAFLSKFNKALQNASYGPAEPTVSSLEQNASGNPVLKWNAVSGATGYCVYRREAGGGSWSRIGAWIKTTSYTDTTAQMNTAYEYCVRSYIYKSASASRLYSTYGNHYMAVTVRHVYTVSPSTAPYNNAWVNTSYYNSDTKYYYLLRSYLDEMAEQGGTLILQAGTYDIPYTLFVPSNVTIRLSDGVVINKTADVGNAPSAAANILFAFADSADASEGSLVKGYAGVHDSSVIGEGTVRLNTSCAGTTMFLLGHNSDIEISNLAITLEDGTSYGVKVYGSENVTISNCTVTSTKNAVTPVLVESAGGTCTSAPAKWCSLDGTISRNLRIEDCFFSGTQYGIYNRYYVSGKYFSGFSVNNTVFSGITKEAVQLRNDSATSIRNCTFENIAEGAAESSYTAVHFYGSKNPVITGNTFDRVPMAVIFSNNGSICPSVSETVLTQIVSSNTVGEMHRYYVAVKQSDGTNQRRYFSDSTNAFTITPESTPFQNRYTYTADTRFYYSMRAALEQLESIGGGTITVKAGDYTLSGVLYVPSNTEIILEDGVTITKGDSLGVMFAFANRADISSGVTYSAYNGVHDSSVHAADASAQAVLDNKNVQGVIFELGHTKNISIYGLTMTNMNGSSHFIELDASTNVRIYGNTFSGCLDQGAEKEAINIDVPDPNTGGFTGAYSSQDKTANKTILIYDNVFQNVPVGVGTHMYTDTAPHTDIRIYGNTFEDLLYYGITARNWTDFRIYDNTFRNIGIGGTGTFSGIGCVFAMAGIRNPYVTDNVVTNADTLMRIDVLYYSEESGAGAALLQYAPVYNDISEAAKELMYENTCTGVARPWIYYRNAKTGSYELWYRQEPAGTAFSISTSSIPYMEKYMSSSVYTEDTRLYYVIRSYLEHLEEIGGGTLKIAAGVYPITRMLNIPSNVTIEMEDGTVLRNANGANIMLNFRSQNVDLADAGDYAAASGITISGGTIDTAGVSGCQPVFIAKADHITVSGVDFTGGCGYYARVFSSRNVRIQDCTFEGTETTHGVIMNNSYNGMPCVSVTIDGCTFSDMEQGIVTSAQTAVYHQDITITDSGFIGCTKDAILLYRIQNAVISRNSFSDMTGSDSYGARLYGMNGLTMNENTFSNMYNCASVFWNQNYGDNTITSANKERMRTTSVYDSAVVNPYISFRATSASATEKLTND